MNEDLYEKHNEEFLRFERVETKFSQRPDLHAFILLDKIIPDDSDIISASEHDEIYLSVSPEELLKEATEEQLIELIRCGVRYDSQTDSLSMFT